MASVDFPELTETPYLRYRDAAQLLRCSESTVKRMVARGQLRSVKLNKLRRIPLDALAELGTVA